MGRLYTLCWLSDGFHWVLCDPDGAIVETSPCGFHNEVDARIDVAYRI